MAKQLKLSFRDLKKQFRSSAYYNNPNNFGKEGEDHINISNQSETRLGRVLDPSYLKVINYRHAGKFNSVLSLWYWVRSKDLDDNFRRLTGRKLKLYAKNNGVYGNYVPNFKAIIAYATWLKVKSYPEVLKALKEMPDDMKFLSYHIVKSSNLRVCTNYASLIISIANEIKRAVKEGVEPDFDKFVDAPDKAGLLYMEGVLSKILTDEKINELKETPVAEDEEEDYEELPDDSSEEELSEESEEEAKA